MAGVICFNVLQSLNKFEAYDMIGTQFRGRTMVRFHLAMILFSMTTVKAFAVGPKGCPDVSQLPRYLEALVTGDEKVQRGAKQHFALSCAEGHPDNEYYMVWLDRREMFLLGWPLSKEQLKNPGLARRKVLNLKTDVVEKEADIGTSTYLVTKEWAANILFSAYIEGPQFEVAKQSPVLKAKGK